MNRKLDLLKYAVKRLLQGIPLILAVTTSYDLNYRATLWSKEKARAAAEQLMPYIDVILGNEEDFDTMLGIKAEGTDENFSYALTMSHRGLTVENPFMVGDTYDI